jgi:rhomboid protease GluP
VLTRILITINVIVYGWEFMHGIASADANFEPFGGLYGPDVLAGQWWRIATSTFMHAGTMHILFNMLALYQVGSIIEQLYGTFRMAIIYTLSAIAGALAVVYFAPNEVAVGASGAIFGLFGALAIAGLRLGKPGRDMMRQTTGVIVINLAIGFWPGSQIAYQDHIGGLIAGGLSGLLLFRMPRHLIAAATEHSPSGIAYAQRLDPYADPGVVTIEHPPTTEPSPPPHA